MAQRLPNLGVDLYENFFIIYNIMIRINRFNESLNTSEVTKEDIEDLEDYFLDVKDEWDFAPSKWLSNPLTAPKGFNLDDYKFYYHFYLPFCDKIALSKVGGKSKNVVDFSIQTYNTVSSQVSREEYFRRLEHVKNKLLVDIDRFLDVIKHLGWEVYDWSLSRSNFINPKLAWSNTLVIYLYK